MSVISQPDRGHSGGVRIRGFDGMRGLAASVVVVHHALIYHTTIGELGVLLFFVLSGYLIIGILHRSRLAVESGAYSTGKAFGTFWWNRILRICPPYYLALIVVAVLQLIVAHQDSLFKEFVWYLLYLQNFYIGLVSGQWDIFTHTWTLAIEQQFYLLFSPLLLLVGARHHVAATAVVALIAFVLWSSLLGDKGLAYAATLLPMRGIIFLAAGGILVLLAHRIPSLVSGYGAAFLAAMFLVWDVGKGKFEHVIAFDPGPQLRTILLVLSLSVVVLHVVRYQQGFIVRILEWPILRFLGMISYTLYIVHYPIAIAFGEPYNDLVIWLGGDPHALGSRLVYFVFVFSTSVGLAAASWYGLERRALELKSRPLRSIGGTSPSIQNV